MQRGEEQILWQIESNIIIILKITITVVIIIMITTITMVIPVMGHRTVSHRKLYRLLQFCPPAHFILRTMMMMILMVMMMTSMMMMRVTQSYSHQVGIWHHDEGWEYDTVKFPPSTYLNV